MNICRGRTQSRRVRSENRHDNEDLQSLPSEARSPGLRGPTDRAAVSVVLQVWIFGSPESPLPEYLPLLCPMNHWLSISSPSLRSQSKIVRVRSKFRLLINKARTVRAVHHR